MALDPAAWRTRPGMDSLLDALDAKHGATRLVGGAVRDLALGLQDADLDLATRLRPEDVMNRLADARIKAIPTGLAHGTVTAVASGTVVEITTLRSDVATDGRRATVAFTDDWAADAARRDFTINALYADPLTGEMFDPTGKGRADLEARRVRFIGEPLERIAEDHLRIMRFFRFHARFAAGAPDEAALAACTARANDLMALSRERIADELLKLLALADPLPTIRTMVAHAILLPVLPEITETDRLATLLAAEHAADIPGDPLRRLAALIPQDPLTAEKIAARLKLSVKARRRLALAAATTDLGSREVHAYRLGTESAIDRLLLANRPADAVAIATWPIPRLPISGGDLIAKGVPQGPLVARTLKAIEQAWLDAGFAAGADLDDIVAGAIIDHGAIARPSAAR
ncbi:CCA tRNA nucleotidyltransferase [Sphingomonas sp.]|uniref:CCA tRNA nucleotidyltransferase n=1 Tax=Sphingomonas sp. TaxID=28214 RepID=UPI0025FBB41D|nr:CCA tRNA nucleotidyltransferase [Sphingomonas sp.]